MNTIPQPAVDAFVLVCAAALAAARYAIGRWVWSAGVLRTSVDGASYIAMSCGEPVTDPYHARWLLPWLFRGHRDKPAGQIPSFVLHTWVPGSCALQIMSSVLCAGLALAVGLTPGQAVAAAAIWVGLPGVFDVMTSLPVLVDAGGYCIVFACGLAAACGSVWGIAAFGFLLATCRPVALPVAAAMVYAVWPFGTAPEHVAIALVVLIAASPALVAARLIPHKPRAGYNRWRLQTGYDCHQLLDIVWLVLPWGACLFAFASPSAAVVAVLLYGAVGLLMCNGTVRVMQIGAPVVVLAAVPAIPPAWLFVVCLVHWCAVSLRSDWRKPCPGL